MNSTVVCVTGGKGGPGSTSAAIGLAGSMAARGDDRVLLVDLDPAGGDVAAYLTGSGVDLRRGLFPLASLGGPELDPAQVAAECIQAAPRLWVLAGLPWPGHGLVSAELIRNLLACCRQLAELVVVDAGRLIPGGPAVQVVAAAEVALLVVRVDLPGALAVRRALEALPDPLQGGVRVGLLTVAIPRRTHREVAELARTLGYPVVGVIPADARGARRVAASGRPPRRGRLARAYGRVTDAVLAEIASAPQSPVQDQGSNPNPGRAPPPPSSPSPNRSRTEPRENATSR